MMTPGKVEDELSRENDIIVHIDCVVVAVVLHSLLLSALLRSQMEESREQMAAHTS